MFRYKETFEQSVDVGKSTWIIKGAGLGLVDNFSYDPFSLNGLYSHQSVGIASNSTANSFDQFPNYAGDFEYSVTFVDTEQPFSLFNLYPVSPYFFPQEGTGGVGSLSTRSRDSQHHITDGYFINFVVDKVSATPIPLPGTLLTFLSGLLALFLPKRWEYWKKGMTPPTNDQRVGAALTNPSTTTLPANIGGISCVLPDGMLRNSISSDSRLFNSVRCACRMLARNEVHLSRRRSSPE